MNGKPFTEIELATIQNTSLTHSEVSFLTGRSINSIFSKRKQLGIIEQCKGHRRQWTGDELDIAFNRNIPLPEASKLIDKSKFAISAMRYTVGP